jgi:hypothetical protein
MPVGQVRWTTAQLKAEYQNNAILGVVATSPLHPAAPASSVAVLNTASPVAVRQWSPNAAHHQCEPLRPGSADQMIATVVTTAAVAAASAFVPAIPVEAYLVAVVTTTGTNPVAPGIAAGLGQTAGKLLTFLAARGVIRSSQLRRWLAPAPIGPDPDRRTGHRCAAPGFAHVGASR